MKEIGLLLVGFGLLIDLYQLILIVFAGLGGVGLFAPSTCVLIGGVLLLINHNRNRTRKVSL